MKNIKDLKVMIFGIGGVGGYIADTLARAGVENFLLIDSDKVEESNLNRQIIATKNSLGEYKTEVMKKRILSLNKNACVETLNIFFDKDTNLNFSGFDWIIDAIDSIGSKLEIISRSTKSDISVISCMGAGKRLNPREFLIGRLYDTSVCPLAKRIRKLAKNMNLPDIPVLYSKELPLKEKTQRSEIKSGAKAPLGSISYSVATAGMLVAYYILDKEKA